MKLECLENDFSICKLDDISHIDLKSQYVFIAKTDEEISLVCESVFVPLKCVDCNHGWKAMRVWGQLDFSLVGILADITDILRKNLISVFVISSFNTDYILVKNECLSASVFALEEKGYVFDEEHPNVPKHFHSSSKIIVGKTK